MQLLDFKDKYKGHRAFFVGHGPSLRKTPLHLMKDEYCFGCNKVYLLFEQTEWRPTHYIAATSHNCYLKDWALGMEKAAETGIPCFLADWYWDEETPKWFHPPEGDNVMRIPAMRLRQPDGTSMAGWSSDCSKEIYSHRTVSLLFMQLAHWMGFGPLYLVGCDIDYKTKDFNEPDPNHWNVNYDAFPRSQENADKENLQMHQAHLAMSMLAKHNNVEVYNATIGGKLEAYPRVDIFEVLGER